VKPLFHPAIEDVTVEGILHALADPVRVAIYAQIVSSDCSTNCATLLKLSRQDIPKSTMSQHFRALREAGLIRGERHGVEMRNTSRCAEIEARFPGLIPGIVKAYAAQSEGGQPGAKAGKRGTGKGAAKGR
jgi:DNA-binding transcriptional ArsR family regulator